MNRAEFRDADLARLPRMPWRITRAGYLVDADGDTVVKLNADAKREWSLGVFLEDLTRQLMERAR